LDTCKGTTNIDALKPHIFKSYNHTEVSSFMAYLLTYLLKQYNIAHKISTNMFKWQPGQGMNWPESDRAREQKFQGTNYNQQVKMPGSERATERIGQGANWPGGPIGRFIPRSKLDRPGAKKLCTCSLLVYHSYRSTNFSRLKTYHFVCSVMTCTLHLCCSLRILMI